MSDDRRKPGFRHNSRTDVEIEAMAKVVTELLGFAHQHNVRRGRPRTTPSSWIAKEALSQTEQPTSSLSFQGTAHVERAIARRARWTPRRGLAMAGKRRRQALEARFPLPPSERRRHRRVCFGEPPVTLAVTLDDAALGQSPKSHGDCAFVALGCLRPLDDASLGMVAHSFE
jgi:hypothetical protein